MSNWSDLWFNLEDIIIEEELVDDLFYENEPPNALLSNSFHELNDAVKESLERTKSDSGNDYQPAASPSNLFPEFDDFTVNEYLEVERASDSGDDYQPDAPPSNSETESDSLYRSTRTRKKRHHVDPNKWERRTNATKRQRGKEYLGVRKRMKFSGDKVEYVKVHRAARVIEPRCNCKRKNVQCDKLTDSMRQMIFDKYWALSWEEKRFYVCQRIESSKIQRPRHRTNEEQSRRGHSFKYSFQIEGSKFDVCQKMFINTLSVNSWTIQYWKKQQEKESVSPNFEIRRPSRGTVTERRMFVRNFLKTLPMVESHYCRKDSRKHFLEPLWNSKADLFAFYKAEAKKDGVTPVCITIFMREFIDLNLSIFTRRKDECETCVSFRQGNLSEEKHQEHLTAKTLALDEKTADKGNPNFAVFTVDLQSVLLAPLNNSSAMYYHMKLKVHNLTMYNLETHAVHCYLWTEVDADLSANVFASFYCNFIKNVVLPDLGTREIVFFSDGCGYQNRNHILTNALMNCALELNIVIHQKYLVSGHTMMECDSAHSTIERRLRKKEINVPADYIDICKTARKNEEFGPYSVTYCDQTMFKDFESIRNIKSIRPGRNKVNEVSAFRYDGNDGSIQFKLDFSSHNYEDLESKDITFNFVPFDDLPQLFISRIPITADKFKHLQQLKASIPPDYHSFYDNLPYAEKKSSEKAANEKNDLPVQSKKSAKSSSKKSAKSLSKKSTKEENNLPYALKKIKQEFYGGKQSDDP